MYNAHLIVLHRLLFVKLSLMYRATNALASALPKRIAQIMMNKDYKLKKTKTQWKLVTGITY
jgi:hypothetical protein